MPDYTLLVIDYEPTTVESVRSALAGRGWRIEAALNGTDGVEAFDRLRPSLTLIEFMLPRKPGPEVCLALRATSHGKKSKLVMMGSRFRSRQDRKAAVQRFNADDYLEKPVTEETLLTLVHRLLNDGFLGVGEAPAGPPPIPQAVVAGDSPPRQPAADSGADEAVIETVVADEADNLANVLAPDPVAEASRAAVGVVADPGQPPRTAPGDPDSDCDIADHLDSLFGDG